MIMRREVFAAACLLIFVGGCDRDKPQAVANQAEQEVHFATLANDPRLTAAGVAVPEVARAYKKFELMTPKNGVFVNPGLAMVCRGVSEAEVQAQRPIHGVHANTSITIYMNGPAAAVFRQKKSAYPAGSVIVKDKTGLGYHKNSNPRVVVPGGHGAGGMIKRSAGFDPDHGDWEYFYFEDPANIESGKISTCVKCHAGASQTDYVFGSWAAAQE
jgi:hypothetical protein